MRFSGLTHAVLAISGLAFSAAVLPSAASAIPAPEETVETPVDQSSGTVDDATHSAQQTSARQSGSLVNQRINSFSAKAFSPNQGQGVAAFDLSGKGGAAGGKSEPNLGVWGDLGYTSFKDSATVTQSSGSVWTGAFGADYLVHPRIMIGLAGTVEGLSGSADASRTNFDSKAVGLAPYAAIKITDIFSASVTFGYAWGEVDMSRSTATGDMAGATTSTRLSTAGTVSANTNFGNFTFGGDLGLSYTSIDQDDFWMTGSAVNQYVTGNTTEQGTVSIEARPGYLIEVDRASGSWIEPFASFGYSYDFVSTDVTGHPNDDDAFNVGAGMNVFTDDNVAFSAGASTELGREDYRSVSANLTARVSF